MSDGLVRAVTVCAQCALKAMLKGEPPPSFHEEPEAHMARVHPDPVATRAERDELERQFAERHAQAKASRFN